MNKPTRRTAHQRYIVERAYNNARAVQEAFDEYIDDCIAAEKVPNKAGFYLHAGINANTFNKYKSKHGEEFAQVAANIENILQDNLIQLGMKNPKIQAMPMFLLKARHNYSDRPQNQINIGVSGDLNFHKWKKQDLEEKKAKFNQNRQLEEQPLKVEVTEIKDEP